MKKQSRFFSALALSLCLFVLCFSQASAAPLLARQDKPGKNAAALQRVLNDLAGQRTEVINIQRELVARPAIGPEAGGEGEEAKAAWIMTLLKDRGITHVERVDSVDRTVSLDPDAKTRNVRPNIIVRYPGAAGLEKGRTLWIICHMHVAAPGPLELWEGSPWTLRVRGDVLHGRGVMDNYQSITAALLLFESLAKNQSVPPMNLGLVLHSQNSGFRYLLENKPELFRADDLFLVPDYGSPQGTTFGVAEKGLLWLKITIAGKPAHAAAGSADSSALVAGSRFIAALSNLDTVFSAHNALFTTPVSTFVPTKAFTNADGINAVAAEYTLYLDSRFVPPYTPGEVEQSIRGLAESLTKGTGTAFSMERLLAYPALPPTSEQSPVALALGRAVRAQLGGELKTEGISTTTAASFVRAKGLPVVVWAKMDPANRQSPNEHALIGDHLDEARVFARMLFDEEAAKAAPVASPTTPKAANGAETP